MGIHMPDFCVALTELQGHYLLMDLLQMRNTDAGEYLYNLDVSQVIHKQMTNIKTYSLPIDCL